MHITTGIRRTSTLAMLAYAVAIAPANALATNRYVGVGGSTTDVSCTDPAHPCELQHAITTVAAAGDDVTVGPGHYTVPTDLSVDSLMTIHGQAGAPRPVLSAGDISDSPATGTPVLRDLNLELSGHLFFGRGVAERLIVVGASDACTLSGTLVFRDSVCVSSSAGGPAVDIETNGGTESLELRNDTIVATASTGVGIKAATQATGGSVTVNLFNTIAQGGPSGADISASTLGIGTVTVNTNHSAFAKAVPSGPGAAINTSVTDQHVAPVFAPGSYHEAATSSSTIGKGAADPNNGPLDLDGDLRAAGGVTDIGADQYVTAPAVSGVSGSAHDTSGSISATVDTHGSPTTYLVRYGTTPAYGSTSATVSLPASASPSTVSIPLAGLSPGATYHVMLAATNNGGTSTSADASFTGTVTPPPPPPPPGGGHDVVAPQDGSLSFLHSTFAVRRARTSAGARRRRVPVGTSITYSDSQAATTTLTVQRRVRGIVRGRRCVAARPRSSGGRHCWRYVTVGTLTHHDRAGRNRLVFTGRVHGRLLSPGRYKMTAIPVNARGMHGRPRTHAFTVASPAT